MKQVGEFFKVFEVGKTYGCDDRCFDPVTIVRRTDKTVWVVVNGNNRWSARIRRDDCGNEYIIDSTRPKWALLTWSSKWEEVMDD